MSKTKGQNDVSLTGHRMILCVQIAAAAAAAVSRVVRSEWCLVSDSSSGVGCCPRVEWLWRGGLVMCDLSARGVYVRMTGGVWLEVST